LGVEENCYKLSKANGKYMESNHCISTI
jgi:hypothetical protein